LNKYVADIDRQDATKEQFKVAITCCNDIAAHIRKTRELPYTDKASDDYTQLEAAGIMSEELCENVIEMTGFRNALAHDYDEIREPEVFDNLQNLTRFERFDVKRSGSRDGRS
jgi:uncharacterized protein YutE (UPF0331/DUF86 family)